MMFNPTEPSVKALPEDERILARFKRRPLTKSDVFRVFMGGYTPWIRIFKVIYKKQLWGKETRLMSRDYGFRLQRDEFISDMFDISLSHKIIAVDEPCNVYIEESDTTNIDDKMIEAIVGKVD
jgi:hypothetical protein